MGVAPATIAPTPPLSINCLSERQEGHLPSSGTPQACTARVKRSETLPYRHTPRSLHSPRSPLRSASEGALGPFLVRPLLPLLREGAGGGAIHNS